MNEGAGFKSQVDQSEVIESDVIESEVIESELDQSDVVESEGVEAEGVECDASDTDTEASLEAYAHEVALGMAMPDTFPVVRSEPRRPSRGNGWLVGIVLGILVGLWMLPPVRYTLSSQLDFALALDSLPWMRPFSAQSNLKEATYLEEVAKRLPDDYLLQVGRATAFVEEGGVRAVPTAAEQSGEERGDLSDHSLIRLTRVAHSFPISAGAQAHLVRYLMVDRVRILREELTPPLVPHTLPPRYTDVKLTLWALKNGERLDPDNAFWPAMRAITDFAAGHDQLALDALEQAANKSRWQSYLYEEVLGQWRLYSVAYGDHGAVQQIGPLSLIAFPHLQQMRHMAEMARWEADRASARGDIARAIHIRYYVRKLGRLLCDSATWAYEALFGTDLVLISASDSNPAFQETTISSVAEWKRQASKYLAFLKANNKLAESTVLEREVEDCCRLRAKVNIARADASYPGIPPGIPLIELFGNWMAGVALLQQFLMLLVGVGIALIWQQFQQVQGRTSEPSSQQSSQQSRLSRLLFWSLLVSTSIGIGFLLFSSLPSSRLSSIFFACVALVIVMLANGTQGLWWRFRRSGALMPVPSADIAWNRGTFVRFLVAIVIPAMAQLWLFRPFLSGLHPVALLLTSLIGIDPPSSPLHALLVGYLACALPFLLVLTLTLWALRRSVPVAHAVAYGLRRLFLPTLIGTCLFYLLLLNQTLRLDSEASHAINEAARDDLHWVLTHSEAGP